MFPCDRMLGLEIPTQDEPCCLWCGQPAETDICAACQQRYEEETAND